MPTERRARVRSACRHHFFSSFSSCQPPYPRAVTRFFSCCSAQRASCFSSHRHLNGPFHLFPNFAYLPFYFSQGLSVLLSNESANSLIFGSFLEIKWNLPTISVIFQKASLTMPITSSLSLILTITQPSLFCSALVALFCLLSADLISGSFERLVLLAAGVL